MKWYQGTIPEAIAKAKQDKTLFVVYLRGADDNEDTSKMDAVWQDDAVEAACESHRNVAIKIQGDSEDGKFFGQIFPILIVPSTYFIGINGVPLEVTGGFVEKDKFIDNINTANQKLKDQMSQDGSAQNTSAAAAAPPQSQAVPGPSQTPTQEVTQQQGDLSAQEKAEKANQLRMKLRDEKLQKEKEQLKAKEDERRQLGKDMQKLKQFQAEKEREDLAEQMKKDREDDKRAREKIKEQIARDREERSARFRKEKEEQEKSREAKKQAQLQAQQQALAAEQARKSESARIQVRLPDGSSISNIFPSSDTLESVHQFVSSKVGSDMSLSTTFPKRYFTDEERTQSLTELGLAPSAVVIAVHRKKLLSGPSGGGGSGTVSSSGVFSLLLSPFVAIWNFLYLLLFGGPSQAGQGSRSDTQDNQQPTASSTSQRPSTAHQRRGRQPDGNIHRFSNTMDQDDDEDRSTWNGNSTQQL